MRVSSIVLMVGALIAATGAALSLAGIEPYADYVLVTGAVLIVIRGFIRNHERDDENRKS